MLETINTNLVLWKMTIKLMNPLKSFKENNIVNILKITPNSTYILLNHKFMEWRLCAGHCIKHLFLFSTHQYPLRWALLLPSFFMWGIWDSERLGRVSNVWETAQLEIRPRHFNSSVALAEDGGSNGKPQWGCCKSLL